MGKKDLLQSRYFDSKARFADAFNGVLFEGRQLMRPEELEEADNELIQLLDSHSAEKIICDKIRKWKGTYCSILVLENQSLIDYRMVLRAMKAEIYGYEKQRENIFEENIRKGIPYDGCEYLSKMKKGQKLIPILTLVLYMGVEKPWDGARTLYQLLDINPVLEPYISNYKLNLYDFHAHQNFSRFRTENRALFEALSCAKDKEKMKQAMKEHPSWYQNLEEEVATAITGIAGIRVDLKQYQEKGGTYNLCKAFEDYKEEGREEGRLEGRREGMLEGRREGMLEGRQESIRINLKSIIKNLNLTIEQAMDVLEIPAEERKQYLPLS